MKTVYVFSGLGADERVFHKTAFGNCTVIFIKWITPAKNEAIESYALRITQQITTTHPILVGLSFGGMMAVEVAKLITTEKIILVSSAKCKSEIPFYFRLAGKLGIAAIFPTKALIKINVFTNWFFSNRTLEDKKMLSAVLHDTDPIFLKWAIVKIANWQNKTMHPNLFHIHGNADRILPFKYITCNEVIKDGAHLMIVNRAAEVSNKLQLFIN
jgi:pimeloyl-ACP methyl ester carboxylesterase